jgi:hypothetical protein
VTLTIHLKKSRHWIASMSRSKGSGGVEGSVSHGLKHRDGRQGFVLVSDRVTDFQPLVEAHFVVMWAPNVTAPYPQPLTTSRVWCPGRA